jgi:enediyne biosynthesis protein E4
VDVAGGLSAGWGRTRLRGGPRARVVLGCAIACLLWLVPPLLSGCRARPESPPPESHGAATSTAAADAGGGRLEGAGAAAVRARDADAGGVVAGEPGAGGVGAGELGAGGVGDAGASGSWFAEVTARTGIAFTFSSGREAGEYAILESLGGGVAVFDFDGDGRMDLMFAGGGGLSGREVTGRQCGLFRNLGQWEFAEATRNAGAAADRFYNHGVFPADFDNDGFEDLAISGYGGVQLLHNQGDGTFVELPWLATHPAQPWSSSLAWADFNRDGVLDLYVAHYVDWSWRRHPQCAGAAVPREVCPPREFAGVGDAIYMATGDGQFERLDRESGLVGAGKGLGVVAADVDLDGDIDLYVANDTTDNFLYLNDGHGRFEETAVLAGVAGDEAGISTGSMGTYVFDATGDGLPDIWVANFERELFALYRNEGAGLFSHVSRAVGLAAVEGSFVGFGTVAVDYDRDGDLDLVVANGHVSYASPFTPFRQQPLLIENVRGRFERVMEPGYFATGHSGRGLAAGDLDDDGRVDLVFSHLEEPVAVLQGTAQGGPAAIGVRLVGTHSSRNAVGATVRLSSGRLLMHNGGSSYLSSSDPRLWLTGDLATGELATDEIPLRVTWPSGKEQEYVLSGSSRQWTLLESGPAVANN